MRNSYVRPSRVIEDSYIKALFKKSQRKEYHLNYMNEAGVEVTEYFDTTEEGKKFLSVLDNNKDLTVLEYNWG